MTNYRLHEQGLRSNMAPALNGRRESQLRKHPMNSGSDVDSYRSMIKYSRAKQIQLSLLDRVRFWFSAAFRSRKGL